MRIALVINKPARELPIMHKIERWAIQAAPGTEFLVIDCHEPDFHVRILEFTPRVVLTFPFTAAPISAWFYLIKYLTDCFVVCYRTEGAIDFGSEKQLRWLVGMDRYGRDFVDYELFWGKKAAELVGGALLEQGKLSSPERIRHFGYPNLEEHLGSGEKGNGRLPEWLDRRLDAAGSDRTFFFITGFHLADYSREDLVNAGDIAHPDDPHYAAELQTAVDGAERARRFRLLWIEQILRAARENPEALFVVKCHPIEALIHSRNPDRNPYHPLTLRDNVVFIDTNVPVGDLLPRCGLFFHYGSTCLAESYLLRVPSVFLTSRAIYCQGTPTPYDYSDLGWPSTLTVDIPELPGTVRRHLAEPISFDVNREAMERVLDDVFNVKESDLEGSTTYLPSRDLALFLLGLEEDPPQRISPTDPYLLAAARFTEQDTLRGLGASGMKAYDDGKTRHALHIFDTMAKLNALSGRRVPDLDYLRAACRADAGDYATAAEILGELLAAVPGYQKGRELLTTVSAKLKEATPGGAATGGTHPVIFTIETTLACDLRCPECAIGGGMIQRDRQLMSFASYRAIADKIRPFASYVYLHIWGEPMLNPDIFEMIRYTSRFAGTNISTNGQSITAERAKELIASGVSDVIVSIDGVSQEVYGKYRVGGDVEKAFRALTHLVAENRAQGGRVNIIPQFIVFEHNQHEMEPFAARCRELGLSPSFKAPYLRKDDSHFAYCGNPAFQRPHLPDLASLRDAMKECPNPKEVFTVLSDGSVVACCHDYSGATTFGNIFHQEVLEIWDSPRCRAFREAVGSGCAPQFCTDSCMTWFLDKGAKRQEKEPPRMVNLCCGPILIPGFINIDAMPGGDLQIDLERELLPFPDGSIDALVCISAINYFSYQRGREIIADVHRVLKPGGVARFATQDLKLLAGRYLERDRAFYFETLPDGRDRFPGETFCDKLNAFFYGFHSGDKHCKYVYDAESLSRHFQAAGFARVEEKPYLDSAVPGAERFDNRPEQMFFLEASKGEAPRPAAGTESRYEMLLARKERQLGEAGETAAGYRERGMGILAKNPERGWQLLLKALELDPCDREATLAVAAILERLERHGDLVKLLSTYLKRVPSDAQLVGRAKQALARAEAKHEELKSESARQYPQIAALDARRNRVLSDREHLEAGIAWLRHAQKVNPAHGVAASYYFDTKCWDVDYPETTGYIIPTFLAHYRLTGDKSYRDDAIRMGEWEVDIQAPEGGAGEPVGVYGLRPRVFNTGQVLLGFVSLYRETGDRAFLDAALRAGDWILSCQDQDGKWSQGVYRGPRSYKSRVAWALLELAEASGLDRYRAGGRRAIEWTLAQGEENGFFHENSLTDPARPWTHLIGYVHVGLLEACRFPEAGFDRERTLKLLRNAARALAAGYLRRRNATPPGELTVFPGTFDPSWESRDNWSCITGNAQIEFFLRRMLAHLDDRQLEKAADGMLADLKRLQYIDGIDSADLLGGLPGAYPLGAPYCTNSIPNWGVKFFADGLLQRLLPAKELDCIG